MTEDIVDRIKALHRDSYDPFTKNFTENILLQGFISDKQLKLFLTLEENREDINEKIFSIDCNSDPIGNIYW